MPRVLTAGEVDLESEALDAKMTEAEEQEARTRFAPTENVQDLTDGGVVNGARLYPTRGGVPTQRGRPVARMAWMWNGTESLVPLAWNPDGTEHDNGRRYFLKRFCLCCKIGGFKAQTGRPLRCPNCVKNNCDVCQGGTSTKRQVLPSGEVIHGYIIRNFYPSKDQVPYPMRFYGDVDCFMVTCIRRGARGFKTEEDMRIHARTRHTMEYQVHLDAQMANRQDENAELRARVAELTSLVLQGRNGAPQQRRGRKPGKNAASSRAQEPVTIQ